MPLTQNFDEIIKRKEELAAMQPKMTQKIYIQNQPKVKTDLMNGPNKPQYNVIQSHASQNSSGVPQNINECDFVSEEQAIPQQATSPEVSMIKEEKKEPKRKQSV